MFTTNGAAEAVSRNLANTGVLSGGGPLDDELSIFFVQATIIIGIGRFLSFIGIYLKQPQVIFEIIGGILIGPTALSRDPDFKNTLFTPKSISYLQLVADIGLVLYLFIIGMELDPKLLKSHAKRSGSIAVIGMAVPFALGVAICRVMFDTLQGDDPKFKNANFTAFFVFIGTAMSITAFPVLARILKEGGLIYTKAGTMVMGAAAINDALAWCLLILAISIANASDMAVAGYVFLSVVAMALGLFFIIRPLLWKIVYKVEAYHSVYMNTTLFAFTLCALFMCSWTTTLLGVHSIFGAFLFGLIIPRDTHLFRECNERIEYLVMVMFLPLYFAISGLKTDITQITEGKQWAMVVLVCFIASIGKFIGCGGPALLSGMTIRESAVVAVLMNTRGLVELIVLNLGLQAGILSTKTFSVMVIMCLFTTFLTSPIIECIYPKHMRLRYESGAHEKQHQKEAAVVGYDLEKMQQQLNMSGSNNNNNNYTDDSGGGGSNGMALPLPLPVKTIPVNSFVDHLNLCVVVDSLSHLQHLMTIVSCFSPYTPSASLAVTAVKFTEPTNSTSDEFLALLNGRLIRVDEEPTGIDITALNASVTQVKPQLLPLSMLCRSIGSDISAYQVIGDDQEFPAELKLLANENESDIVLLPWRKNSQYFESLFWGSTRKTPVPIMLLVPRDGEWSGNNATGMNGGNVNVAVGVMTGTSTSSSGTVTNDATINAGLKKPPASSYFLPTDFNFPWLKKSSTASTTDGVNLLQESEPSPVIVTRRETAVMDMLSESKSSGDIDDGSSLNIANNYTTISTTLNDIETGSSSASSVNNSNSNIRFSPNRDHQNIPTTPNGGVKMVGLSPDKLLSKSDLPPHSPAVSPTMNASATRKSGPSKPVTVRSIGAIITGKDTDAHILSMLLRLSSQPHMRISVYVAHGYKHHSKGTRTAVKLFARAANNVDNIIMYNLTSTCEDAVHLFRETASAVAHTNAHSVVPGVPAVTGVDLMMSSYILPAAHQYVDNTTPGGNDSDSSSVTGAALTSSRSARPLSTLLPTVSTNRNYLDSSNMTATSSVGAGINNMSNSTTGAVANAGVQPASNLPSDYVEQRKRSLVPEPLIHTTLTHPELGALGTLQYESNLYKYIAVFHEPTPTIRLARDRAMSMSFNSLLSTAGAGGSNANGMGVSFDNENSQSINNINSGGGIHTSHGRISSSDDFGGYFHSMSVSKEVTFNNANGSGVVNSDTVARGAKVSGQSDRMSSMDHGYSVEDLASLASFHTTSTAAVPTTTIPFAHTHSVDDDVDTQSRIDERDNAIEIDHTHKTDVVPSSSLPSAYASEGDLSTFSVAATATHGEGGVQQKEGSDNQNSNTDGKASTVYNVVAAAADDDDDVDEKNIKNDV